MRIKGWRVPMLASLLVWAVVGAAAVFLLTRTTFGRTVYAIGNRERAAYLSGARTRAVVPACPEIETEGSRITMRYPGLVGDPMLPDRRLVLEAGRWRPLDG